MTPTVQELKSLLDVMKVERFEGALAELNSTLADLIGNQQQRDADLAKMISDVLTKVLSVPAPTVNSPITVQPAEVTVMPGQSDGWGSLSVEFRRNNVDGRISGMTITRGTSA